MLQDTANIFVPSRIMEKNSAELEQTIKLQVLQIAVKVICFIYIMHIRLPLKLISSDVTRQFNGLFLYSIFQGSNQQNLHHHQRAPVNSYYCQQLTQITYIAIYNSHQESAFLHECFMPSILYLGDVNEDPYTDCSKINTDSVGGK